MKTLIVSKAGEIASIYDGEPNQSNYGGPWGRPEEYDHIALPEGMLDAPSVLVVTDGVVSEDAVKKSAYLAAKQQETISAAITNYKNACSKLEVDFMTGNALLGMKQDGVAVKMAVATKMNGVFTAIKIGDPEMVIAAIKDIPSSDYDAKYITEARLLAAANTMRLALGLATVSDLADA